MEAQVETGFDIATRELIRKALLRYMEEHRIGTPTLRYKIIEADKPRHREIPLSTLQRFLGNKHHTLFHHVDVCHAFVRDLPHYGEGADIMQLGATLFGFLRMQMQDSERDALIARLRTEFAGTFEVRGFSPQRPDALPFPPEKEATGSLTLTALADGPYLHAMEFERDPMGDDPAARRAYEGAMIVIAPRVHIYLRSSLTRLPKAYCLMRRSLPAEVGQTQVFEGESSETQFMNSPDGRLTRRQLAQFVAMKSETA